MKGSTRRILIRLGWWILYAIVFTMLGIWIGIGLATRGG